jgi:hypothetical protein
LSTYCLARTTVVWCAIFVLQTAQPVQPIKRALKLAAAVPGVEGIVDRLRVAPSVPMSDEAIRAYVCDALYQEPAFATFALKVGIPEGWNP